MHVGMNKILAENYPFHISVVHPTPKADPQTSKLFGVVPASVGVRFIFEKLFSRAYFFIPTFFLGFNFRFRLKNNFRYCFWTQQATP
jgi:hypothetical protein